VRNGLLISHSDKNGMINPVYIIIIIDSANSCGFWIIGKIIQASAGPDMIVCSLVVASRVLWSFFVNVVFFLHALLGRIQ
jgi:hypothetical protein